MEGGSQRIYMNVFTVESYETGSGRGKKGRWARIGVAFPHKDGVGFNVELQAFPRDGRLVVLPPSEEETGRD